MQETLKARKERDDFIHHVIYAQCAMMDDAVLNSASSEDNYVWLRNPLQALFIGQMRAGEVMPERTRALLREAAPDPRLLVLYQRLYGMGYSQRWMEISPDHAFRENTAELTESLNALVPAGEQPLSAALVVERHPTVRGRLLRSRMVHITLAFLLTAGLIALLQSSLQHLLQSACRAEYRLSRQGTHRVKALTRIVIFYCPRYVLLSMPSLAGYPQSVRTERIVLVSFISSNNTCRSVIETGRMAVFMSVTALQAAKSPASGVTPVIQPRSTCGPSQDLAYTHKLRGSYSGSEDNIPVIHFNDNATVYVAFFTS
ncbi:DotU family type IV/VI secretion system protein [Cronobacter sakazakii]|uniref:DotU family type IV/VI secretion system protein n=1 Tax=Cronobacter sakazakii TaxID=28141 RepID=UPI001EFCE13F|nr:DotU family type IV/VI secretion system protein [Cronobacter sakazakii]